MATPTKEIAIGAIILAIFATYFLITMSGANVRLRIDNDKSTFYLLDGTTWRVSGYEYTKLYNGSKLISRFNVSGITRDYSIADQVVISRETRFGKGEITIKESWVFDPNATDVESFPISHTIECLNCKGLILQYEVQKLAYSGPTIEVSSPLTIGKMKMTWQDGAYLQKLYSTGKLWIRYKPISADQIYWVRLFDPIIFVSGVTDCYQETANISTACGGLATGKYADAWSVGVQPPPQFIDGNWDTLATSASAGEKYFWINYSKPSTALSTSLWQFKKQDPSETLNLTINSTCWSYSASTLNFRVGISGTDNILNLYCQNESAVWVTMYADATCDYVYEEAMWWKLTYNNNTLTFNGLTKNFTAELGSLINVSASLNASYCVDIDHPAYGINYTCGGSNESVYFDFNMTYFVRQEFNDSTRSTDIITGLLTTPTPTSNSTNWDAAYPITNMFDNDPDTLGKSQTGNANAWLNYSLPMGSVYQDYTLKVKYGKDGGGSATVDITTDDVLPTACFNQTSMGSFPFQLRVTSAVGAPNYVILDCKQAGTVNTWWQFSASVLTSSNGEIYEITMIKSSFGTGWLNGQYKYKQNIDCKDVPDGWPVMVGGIGNGVTIAGVRQYVWTRCYDNLAMYWTNASEYAFGVNDTKVAFDVEYGNAPSYLNTSVWDGFLYVFHMNQDPATNNQTDATGRHIGRYAGSTPVYNTSKSPGGSVSSPSLAFNGTACMYVNDSEYRKANNFSVLITWHQDRMVQNWTQHYVSTMGGTALGWRFSKINQSADVEWAYYNGTGAIIREPYGVTLPAGSYKVAGIFTSAYAVNYTDSVQIGFGCMPNGGFTTPDGATNNSNAFAIGIRLIEVQIVNRSITNAEAYAWANNSDSRVPTVNSTEYRNGADSATVYVRIDNRSRLFGGQLNISGANATNTMIDFGGDGTIERNLVGELIASILRVKYFTIGNTQYASKNLTYGTKGTQIIFFNMSSLTSADNLLTANFTLNGFDIDTLAYTFTENFNSTTYLNLSASNAAVNKFSWNNFERGLTSYIGWEATYSEAGSVIWGSSQQDYIDNYVAWNPAGDNVTSGASKNYLLHTQSYSGSVDYRTRYRVYMADTDLNLDYSNTSIIEIIGAWNMSVYDGGGYWTCTNSYQPSIWLTDGSSSTQLGVLGLGVSGATLTTATYSANLTFNRNGQYFKFYTDGAYQSEASVAGLDSTKAWYLIIKEWSQLGYTPSGTTCYGTINGKYYDIKLAGLALNRDNFNSSGYNVSKKSVYSGNITNFASNISAATMNTIGIIPDGANISYYISNNWGTWTATVPGIRQAFSGKGSDLYWRIELDSPSIYETPIFYQVELEVSPSTAENITIDVGNDGVIDWSYKGVLNATTSPQAVNMVNNSAIQNYLAKKCLNMASCSVPIALSVGAPGAVEVSGLVVDQNVNPLIIPLIAKSNSDIPIRVSFEAGSVTLSGLAWYYAGGNQTYNVTLHNTDYTQLIRNTVTFFYSGYNWSYPSKISFLEFIPQAPWSKNVTPYGQQKAKPIINISSRNFDSKLMNISIRLNETNSCINVSIKNKYYPLTTYLQSDSSLVLYQPFDWLNINNMNKTLDYSSNGNDGSIIGGANWTAGKYGRAYYFNGSQYINVSDADNLDITQVTGLTISLWIKTDHRTVGSTEYSGLVGKYTSANTSTGYDLILTNGSARMSLRGTTQIAMPAGSQDLRDGVWHFVVGVGEATQSKLYIDGVFVQNLSGVWAGGPNNAPLQIGARQDTFLFNGTIDEVHIWARNLSAAEVLIEYQKTVTDYIKGPYLNTSWLTIASNRTYGNLDEIWLWADYDCNPGNWSFWEPQIDMRACCEGCDACAGD